MAQVEFQRTDSSLSTSSKSMSRLQQMQADLQRKMMREKEEKMIKLYNDTQSKALDKVRQSSAPNNYDGGNVRRFFNERRNNPNLSLDASMASLDSYLLNASYGRNGLNKSIGRPIKGSPVGWDKSYPLVPIERTNSGSSSGYESVNGKPQSGRKNSHTYHPRRQSLERNKPTDGFSANMRRSKSQIFDGAILKSGPNSAQGSKTSSPSRGRPVAVRDVKMNEEKRKMQQEMRKREQELISKIKEQQAEIDRMRQERIKEEKAQKARLMRKPVTGTMKTNQPPPQPQREIVSTPRTPEEPTPRTPISNLKKKPIPVQKEKKIFPRESSGNSDLPECTICGRRFAADRLEKHTQVCSKMASKKRKVFDPVKMRTQGTEMESFVSRKGKTNVKEPPKKVHNLKEPSKAPAKASNWREKHENFLQTIRQAKVVQQHVAAGGKASDLPPPPPLDTSDYVQCPHCGRKFSEGAADRHIPKCQKIKSNKK